MCRCRRELSGSQRPDRGLRCRVCDSSRPVDPLCHGNMAPRCPAARAAARAWGSRRHRYSSIARATSRQPEVQEGQDEHLVPEHVAAVGLAVQAAGRDADVEVDAVRGHGLQQVEDVQAQDQRGADRALDLARRSGTRGGPRPARAGPGRRRSRPARSISSRAASPGSPIPGSRDVQRDTSFSTVTGRPGSIASVRSTAANPASDGGHARPPDRRRRRPGPGAARPGRCGSSTGRSPRRA